MKTLFRLPNLFLLAVAIFAFSSCGEDDTFVIPPSIELLSEAGFLSGDATIGDENIIVKISASAGDNPMQAIDFQQDGARMDASRLTIDGAAAASGAPLLSGDDKNALTWEVEITPHADGVADYTFVASDESGETSSVTITITIEKTPPTLTAPNGITDLSASPSMLTSISLEGMNPSGEALSRLSVWEGGVEATGADRFFFGDNSSSIEFEGGIDLEEADQSGFTKSLFIRTNATLGTVDNYTIQLTDINGQEANLDITVEAKGTALEFTANGVLLNASGPQGQGGLDLDTGNGNINSTSMDAEIKDEGIDLGMPDAVNWKQQISGANGSVIALLEPGNFPEGFDFDALSTKEEVRAAYDASTAIAAASDKVTTGDIFGVYNATADRYYLIRVANVMLTTDDNKDEYTFDIRW